MRHSWIGFLALATACGGGGASVPTSKPADPGATPDPSFAVVAPPHYLLVGDALTPASPDFTMKVQAPGDVKAVYAWIDDAGPTPFTSNGGIFELTVPAASITAGDHRILLEADDDATAFAGFDLSKGAALYVVVSTDWDNADNPDDAQTEQEMLHQRHPQLLLTHLFGPYVFTDPGVADTRRTYLSGWVKMMRDTYGDEIGCHIHPYCSFVTAAGVTCQTMPSTVYPTTGDTTGYTVRLGAYTRDEWDQMFAYVDQLWDAHGMGKPTAFRAGGWTLEISTIQALHDSGYVVDGSPNNWARMEEWNMPPYELYPWNMMQWSTIDDTSQPYYATDMNIQGDTPGTPIGVLELPDNGILVDYVTAQEMEDIFHENWDGKALAAPKQLSIGFHPPDFSPDFFARMDGALAHYDQFLAAKGGGPVVYARMSDTVKVWPAP
jgi:hypothetical protein